MKNQVFMLSRRVALIFSILLTVGLAGACGTDSSSDSDGKETNNGGGGGDENHGEKGVALTYNGESIRANASGGMVNALFNAPMQSFSVTMTGGWTDSDSDPAFGLITTRLTLKGSSEAAPETGTYALKAAPMGIIDLSEDMSAAFVVESAPFGLPNSLAATSGTLTVSTLDFADNKLERISLTFDATFKNASDDADTAEYKLKGSVDLPLE